MQKLTPVIDAFKWLMNHSQGISSALEKGLAIAGYKSGDAGKLVPSSLRLAPDAVATPRADYSAANKRLAGGAFRDAQGRFDATTGDAKFLEAQELGLADDYLKAESADGGRYSPENLERMKRGRAPLARAAQGMSLERASAEFPSLAAAAGPTGVQTPAEAKAAADAAAANARHEQALAMVAALGKRPIVVEIDKKEIARAMASEQHGVGGPI
jgi:hypothetical protein